MIRVLFRGGESIARIRYSLFSFELLCCPINMLLFCPTCFGGLSGETRGSELKADQLLFFVCQMVSCRCCLSRLLRPPFPYVSNPTVSGANPSRNLPRRGRPRDVHRTGQGALDSLSGAVPYRTVAPLGTSNRSRSSPTVVWHS